MRFPLSEALCGEEIAKRVKEEARVWEAISHLAEAGKLEGIPRLCRREGIFYGIARLSSHLHDIKRAALSLEMHPGDEAILEELGERLTELGVHALTMAVYVEGGRDGAEEGDGTQTHALPTTEKKH